MAAVQPRPRPRMNMAPANPRPKTTAAATSNHADTGTSHAVAVAAAAAAAAAAAGPASASPLSVFLANLRLLDLDLLPDWPDITVDTFATTGVQGLKRRIQCVEWALVRLFEMWDPEETCSKLAPFFPPADQMQSVSLRAALWRALDALKKNGVLGRDSVVRKTMLDDCKGERLEEILAYFSTAVLKSIVVRRETTPAAGRHQPIAVKLAMETRGYDCDNTDLRVLNVAYRSSLRRFVEQKEQERALYRDFGDLLSIKERGVRRRMEAVRAKESGGAQEDTLSKNAKEEMRRLVRNNWSGNERWMETLMDSTCSATEAMGLLGVPFDRVWRRVQQGRLAELEEDSGGLLEQLDNRVRLQRDRLARWNTFRDTTFGQLAETGASPSKRRDARMARPNRGIDFQFSSHHGLQVGGAAPTLDTGHWQGQGQSRSSQSYEQLLRGLREDLATIKNAKSAILNVLGPSESRRRSVGGSSLGCQSTDGGETISEMSELEDEPPSEGADAEAFAAAIPVRTNRIRLDSLRHHPVKPQMRAMDVFNRSTSTLSSSSPPARDEELTIRQEDFFLPPAEELEELEPPPSPAQDSAEDILEAMDHASPSPAKHPRQRPTLSLAQRTRLSMAGTQSPFLDEEPELPPRLPPAPRNDAGPTPPSDPDARGPSEAMDLASRTRLSMAGLQQAQKKAQVERRKSLRTSRASTRKEAGYFDKGEGHGGIDHDALTRELLMEEDVEAVFKSRPKMRTSPVGSPGGGW
ncbi:hypothetical protein E4U42_002905 [Claviceps africana]|uniref:HAUS augmin-like complex subunit 6 N-terminal domain-containing protein n=1 Tax=Claviceps africana TaxID=83212 RepID=A0A8K0NJ93_9HYPO|nr:hypothetical protein E4U42_002905 [Claviceps africana]